MESRTFVCYYVTYVCNFNEHPSGVKYIFTTEAIFRRAAASRILYYGGPGLKSPTRDPFISVFPGKYPSKTN